MLVRGGLWTCVEGGGRGGGGHRLGNLSVTNKAISDCIPVCAESRVPVSFCKVIGSLFYKQVCGFPIGECTDMVQ